MNNSYIILKVLSYMNNGDIKLIKNKLLYKNIIKLLSIENIFFTNNLKEVFCLDYSLNNRKNVYEGQMINCLSKIIYHINNEERNIMLIGDNKTIILLDVSSLCIVNKICHLEEIFNIKVINNKYIACIDSQCNIVLWDIYDLNRCFNLKSYTDDVENSRISNIIDTKEFFLVITDNEMCGNSIFECYVKDKIIAKCLIRNESVIKDLVYIHDNEYAASINDMISSKICILNKIDNEMKETVLYYDENSCFTSLYYITSYLLAIRSNKCFIFQLKDKSLYKKVSFQNEIHDIIYYNRRDIFVCISKNKKGLFTITLRGLFDNKDYNSSKIKSDGEYLFCLNIE